MNSFFDTSVMVAAFWGEHPNHASSLDLLAGAKKDKAACGIHSLAEVYATMTALPVRPSLAPEQVLLFIEEISNRLKLISLDENEYLSAIRKSAAGGAASGRIYDALLLACARKCRAKKIYTWNLDHFQRLAPDLATRIQTP